MTKGIRLGAMDWRDPAWTGSFYPADMPEEWRLSYYAGQFNCVFLEAKRWRNRDISELEQWCEAVHSQFIFLLENDEKSTPPKALPQKAMLIDTQDSRIVWFERNGDLKQLATMIKTGSNDGNMFLISRDGDLAQMERVSTLLELLGY